MRTPVMAPDVTGLVLAGCGQGGSSSSSQPAAPPPPLTPAQVKTLVDTLPAPYNTGDPEAGKADFTQCAACHTTVQGGPNMTGPNLYGIFGRKAASAQVDPCLFRCAEVRRLDLGRGADRHVDHQPARRAAEHEDDLRRARRSKGAPGCDRLPQGRDQPAAGVLGVVAGEFAV